MTVAEQWTLAIILLGLAVTFVVASYYAWRKEEREHPERNWGGRPAVRYVKDLLARLADGVFSGISF